MNNKGFTLTEVLVSIVVLALTMGLMTTLFVRNNQVNTKTKLRQEGVEKVNELFEIFTTDPEKFYNNTDNFINNLVFSSEVTKTNTINISNTSINTYSIKYDVNIQITFDCKKEESENQDSYTLEKIQIFLIDKEYIIDKLSTTKRTILVSKGGA